MPVMLAAHQPPVFSFLLAIEGIDGAGKTTLAAGIEGELKRCGFRVVASKEPTQGPFGQQLRDSAATGRLEPAEEMVLLIADRKQHIAEKIGPALSAGEIAILDRYYFSNAAYQGAEGLEPRMILAANESFAPRADLMLLLDVPPKVGLSRIKSRGDLANHFEKEETLEKCREIFNSIVRPEIRKIDATAAADVVFATAMEHLVVAFAEKARKVFGATPAAAEAIRPLLTSAYA